jgi:hypothetical protein
MPPPSAGTRRRLRKIDQVTEQNASVFSEPLASEPTAGEPGLASQFGNACSAVVSLSAILMLPAWLGWMPSVKSAGAVQPAVSM